MGWSLSSIALIYRLSTNRLAGIAMDFDPNRLKLDIK
jgi:hypothetical protein